MNNPTAICDLHEMHRILEDKKEATQRAVDSFNKMIERYGDNAAATNLVNLWNKEVVALDSSMDVITQNINEMRSLQRITNTRHLTAVK
jgi:hypothetical protein